MTAVPGYLDVAATGPVQAGPGPASARSYDRAGRLVEVATSRDGHLGAPVAPGGFTVASR